MGSLTAKGFTEPNMAVCLNGDSAPILSVACTLNHIRKQSEEVQAIMKPLYDGMKAVAAARGYSMDSLVAAVGGNTVRELLEMLQVNETIIQDIDKVLHGMINKIG